MCTFTRSLPSLMLVFQSQGDASLLRAMGDGTTAAAEGGSGRQPSCMQGSLSELGMCGTESALRAGRSRNLSRGFCSERGNNKGAERTLSIRIAQNEMRLRLRAPSTHLTFLSRPVNIRMHQSREISYSHREYLLTETRPHSRTLT